MKKQAVKTLCDILATGDEADRCYAAKTLGKIGDTEAIAALTLCLRDEDIDVCVDAATALGDIGNSEAASPLLESLQNDPNGDVRVAVIEALAEISDTSIVPALIDIAVNRPENLEWDGDWDDWWDIQLKAVEIFADKKITEALPALIGLIDDDDGQDIDAEILSALAKIGGIGTDYLVDRLQHEQPSERRKALFALRHSTDSNSIKAVARLLNDDNDRVRASAIETLTALNADKYLSAVILLLRDESEQVREEVPKAIARFTQHMKAQDDTAVSLLTLLDIDNTEIQNVAILSLTSLASASFYNQQLSEKICALLGADKAELIESISQIVSHFNDANATENLISCASASELPAISRQQCIQALSAMPYDTSITAVLQTLLANKQAAIRQAALKALVSQDISSIEDDDPMPLDIVLDVVKGQAIDIPTNTPAQTVSLDDFASKEYTPEDQQAESAKNEQSEMLENRPESPTLETTAAAPMSTLDAIMADNMEVALLMNDEDEEAEAEVFDEETENFLKLVDANTDRAEEMLPERGKVDINRDLRHMGARLLASVDSPEAMDILLLSLNDKDIELRAEAVDSIARIAERTPDNKALLNATGSLMSQLTLGASHYLRMNCARALGNIGNRTATSQLMDALNDSDSNVRIHSIDALQKLAINGFEPDPDDHMISDVVSILEQLEKLLSLLEDDASGVRVHSASAIATLLNYVDEDQRQTLGNQAIVAIIASAFLEEGHQASDMGKVLSSIDPQASAEKLLSLLGEVTDSMQRRYVFEMLTELFTEKAQVA